MVKIAHTFEAGTPLRLASLTELRGHVNDRPWAGFGACCAMCRSINLVGKPGGSDVLEGEFAIDVTGEHPDWRDAPVADFASLFTNDPTFVEDAP